MIWATSTFYNFTVLAGDRGFAKIQVRAHRFRQGLLYRPMRAVTTGIGAVLNHPPSHPHGSTVRRVRLGGPSASTACRRAEWPARIIIIGVRS